ncbi:SDR family NAD(P)-dependent oxidoreductase [Pusillimonas sp. CC-YST705]|uniref:SDR family NAD(P)-dependent oxidoreductase n=1 Tax=Mesopusillimonas faecipullorum TaxID=2755040 RepID=A0ABS8CBP5_9BURK|nr:type I polyketide synthase [Mesopusillimonas faecipullorum]MCB5363039.1 SDR family NAD(P)-dependent oxidoreductase [Mesopusillimonas faecipullorum]
MAKRVAVIGLAFRFPSTTTEQYWPDLLGGRNLITQVDPNRWSVDAYVHPAKDHPGTTYTKAAGTLGDISGFDADFFGISPREAGLMDPQQRVLMELCWEAIENAGIKPSSLRGSSCGVYVGFASTDYAYRIAEDLASVDSSMATGNTASIAANRLSYFYDLRGPSIALDTACSSSMVAFHQACRAIETGECDQAIAGGISLHLHPYGFIGFSKATMLSRRGQCSVFDADADGYVRSEGGGLFMLKDYDQAVADGNPILAVVAGTVVNTDGRKSGLTVPSIDAQVALMRQAYERAGLTPADIDYLEAHGTGTPVGDPIETHAIGRALGQARGKGEPLPIGSVKTNMGHLETASGVAGLVKAIYALRYRTVPATIGVKQLNPRIKLDDWNIEIVTENRPLRPTGKLIIGVNSFGFGGANAHVILESAPEQSAAPVPAPTQAPLPVFVSGKTEAAMRAMAGRLSEALRGETAQGLYDAAYHLAMRREWHAQRAVLFADSAEQASEQLRQLADGVESKLHVATGTAVAGSAGPVFVYSGNGSQWAGMGKRLLEDPVFAEAIAEVDDIFHQYANFSLAEEFASAADRYEFTEIAQPTLFAIQVGITRMLAHHGVKPAATMGHSVGEVAAAWACGALTLPDAVKVIFHRSRLQGLTKGSGRMSAVGLSGTETQTLIDELGLSAQLTVAGMNSARGATVAGSVEGLDALEAELAARSVFHRRLDLDYAFHSSSMDPVEKDIQTALADIAPRTGLIPFYSTVTGAILAGTELNANYWWRNVRAPVQFEDAGLASIKDGYFVFVEVGPHAVLRSYLADILKTADEVGRVIVTASRNGDEPERISVAAGQVILSGAQVQWDTLFPHVGAHVELPTYTWQRERYWHQVSPETQGMLMRELTHPLLGYALRQHENTWESHLDTLSHPVLADHVVGEATVFPGTGYAELAIAAALRWQTGNYAEVEELEIRAPLLLAPTPAKIVRLVLDASDGRFRINAKEQGSDTPWNLQATGRLVQEAGPALLNQPKLSLPATQPDFTEADHNALTRMVGLDYGPAFRAIEHGWQETPESVLAAFRPDECLTEELATTHLHPALLDCAFQLIIHLLKDDPAMGLGMAFVPAKMGRLVLHAGQGQPRYARARLRRRAPHSLTADFELYDEHGVQIAAVQEARFRSIRLRKMADDHLSFLDFVAQPQPLGHLAQPSALDAPALLKDLQALVKDAANCADQARFSHEVDPLLESLCDRFAFEALSAMADEDGLVSAQALHPDEAESQGISALQQQIVARAVAAGYAESVEQGWKLNPADASEPSATDIWNSLLREYPDYFPAVHAAGRIGMHLPAILAGQLSGEEIRPAAVTPAVINRLMRGAAISQRLSKTLADVLAANQNSLPPGRRLAVLEVGNELPLFGADCLDTLDFNLADYRYASCSTAITEQVQKQFAENKSPADAQLIEGATPTDAQRFDLALFHCEFDTLQNAQQALAYTLASLKPGGVLLLFGAYPSQWADFVFGAQTSWWQEADGQLLSNQQSAEFWQTQLQTLGLHCDALIDFNAQAGAGAYALLAHQSAQADEASAPAPRAILLLGDAEGASAEFAEVLQRHLLEAGHRCRLAQNIETTGLDTLLKATRQQLGGLDDVVHLSGWGTPDAQLSAEALMQAQVKRCAMAAALVQSCERVGADATLWLLTADATQALRHTAQAGTALAALNDAALWGYGRTLANEASNYRVRLVDLPAQQAVQLAPALTQEFNHPDAEDEVILEAEGARYVPRMLQVPRPATQDHTETQEHQAVRLGFEFPGQLRNLRWESYTAAAPGDDEIEVSIQATGLNFRDVMYTLGLLSDEAIENGFAGPTLGLEFSGVVTRTGKNISDYQPGDPVVGFGPASFGDRAITQPSAISHIPQGFSFEAAATIPSTFFTVYYALHYLARLEEGEKILIHGAAGGVGIAAIQYAQSCGAEIYATAGSDEKRDFLRLMGVQHIYDSRSLSYADEILAATDGKGIDVVLNSLAGEAINRNLRVLKPFGRFLELGKRDFYENTRIGLRPFRNNISYFGIDADQLMCERPELTQRLFAEMMALFKQGLLHPLPYSAFEANDVVDAFRYMQQARQIGKVVVTYRSGIKHTQAAPSRQAHTLSLPAQASYLVTGGLGGFGLRTAQWLAEKGARNLILISRSGPNTDAAKQAIAELEARGVRVHAAACDVTDRAALAKLLQDTTATLPPLKGIVHAAVVIADGLARNATPALIEQGLAAKVLGAHHLHDLTREAELDFCIYYSSATTLFGNPGQSSYVAANTWLESLAAQRRAEGLPATCVRWGAIDDVGFLARNEKIKDALQGRMGGGALPSAVALQALEDMLLADANGLGVLELDWRALSRFLPSADAPKFSEVARHADAGGDDDAQSNDVAHLLATLNDEELQPRFADMLKAEISEILRVPTDKIDPTRSVYDMGLDSLMGVELVVALENRFGIRLPVMALNESPTVEKLAQRLVVLLRGDDSPKPVAAVTAAVEQVVASHDVQVSAASVSAFVEEIQNGEAGQPQRMIH